MLSDSRVSRLLPYGLLAAFFCLSLAVRPLLPVDETRYLSVAWEMYLRQSFLVPTLNFEPYFQKPPLLFWLVDLSWAALGVSRATAVLVIFFISSAVIFLTQRMAVLLFPAAQDLHRRMPWLLLGSVPFAVYSTLILFDLLLTACVLGCFISLEAFARRGATVYALLAGLCMGLGLLAKGPVLFIHIAFPVVMYKLWRQPASAISTRTFLTGFAVSVLVAGAIVVVWLGPAFYLTGSEFAHGLVWEQSAGRIAGTARGAHARPFYFYLMLLPLMVLPWAFSPDLWRSRPWSRIRDRANVSEQDARTLLFLSVWCVGELTVFSAISGKQPHYLVPMLPPLILAVGYFMSTVRFPAIAGTAAFIIALFSIVQIVASATILHRYDLTPTATLIAANPQKELAFAGNYQGQLTFLARMEKPFTIVRASDIADWVESHPSGYLVAKVANYPNSNRDIVFSQPIAGEYLVILSKSPTQ